MGWNFLHQTRLCSTPPPPAAYMFRGFQFAITLWYHLLTCVYLFRGFWEPLDVWTDRWLTKQNPPQSHENPHLLIYCYCKLAPLPFETISANVVTYVSLLCDWYIARFFRPEHMAAARLGLSLVDCHVAPRGWPAGEADTLGGHKAPSCARLRLPPPSNYPISWVISVSWMRKEREEIWVL